EAARRSPPAPRSVLHDTNRVLRQRSRFLGELKEQVLVPTVRTIAAKPESAFLFASKRTKAEGGRGRRGCVGEDGGICVASLPVSGCDLAVRASGLGGRGLGHGAARPGESPTRQHSRG